MTYKIPKNVLIAVDQHFGGGLTDWKARHAAFVQTHPHAIEALDIVAVQLFETYSKGHSGALDILSAVIGCETSTSCYRILCPYCRTTKQQQASAKAMAAFSSFPAEEIRFATILLPFESDGAQTLQSMGEFRIRLKNQLRNNADKLGSNANPFKMMGAFEIDLKNMGTDADLSSRSRKLMRDLGYKDGIWKPQYLPHLHAIVGPMDEDKKAFLNSLIEKALGQPLVPWQIVYRSLHKHRAKDENLSRLASYMFKARLQFADNIFADNEMEKQSRYHTPFKGLPLLNYLKAVDAGGNFKGLKFDFGLSSSSA